jgi:hypothetical protein
MPELKSLLMLLAVTVVAAGATWYIKDQIYDMHHVTDNVSTTSTITIIDDTTGAQPEDAEVVGTPITPSPKPPVTPPQGIAPSITGKLTEVNTGCFSDGECYAVVGGKKVILLIGWYQGKVGKILGADSIGDLESYIGTEATVFAGQDDNGDYTLLGNESFYLQVSSTSKPVATGSCVVGGCSSQLCGEESEMSDMVTTCEYQTKYSCYQKATCERQVTGQCDWTETPELVMCLKTNS